MEPAGASGFEIATTFGTWALVIATVGAVVIQGRASRRILTADVFTRLAQQWDSVEMRARRKRLAKSMLAAPGQTPEEHLVVDVITFFEALGMMLRRKQLGVDDAWQHFGDEAIYYWEIVGKDFRGRERQKFDSTAYWSEFSYLVEEMRKHDKKMKQSEMVVTPEDRRDFLESDAKLIESPISMVVLAPGTEEQEAAEGRQVPQPRSTSNARSRGRKRPGGTARRS